MPDKIIGTANTIVEHKEMSPAAQVSDVYKRYPWLDGIDITGIITCGKCGEELRIVEECTQSATLLFMEDIGFVEAKQELDDSHSRVVCKCTYEQLVNDTIPEDIEGTELFVYDIDFKRN